MKKLIKLFLILLITVDLFAQKTIPDSNYLLQDSFPIPTRDGYFISAIILRKKETVQPVPAVLVFTTYNQGINDTFFVKRLVDRGYAGIVAYSRGVKTNIDRYDAYEHDGNDAYDVIDWISKQSWCNGKIGMYGGSYTGFIQWATAKKLHPALKTIVPQVAVMPGFDVPMENNVYLSFTLGWANDILNYKRLPQDINVRWYEAGTSFRSLDSLGGQSNRIFQKWLMHPSYDSYWQSLVPSPAEYSKISIPVLCTTGYYDGAQIAAIKYVKQYFKYNKNQNLYFVIGPYNHFGAQRMRPDSILMGYEIDPVANVSMRGLAFEWLDYILKGGAKPAFLKDKINYEVMGANEWKHSPSFDKMNNDTITFYLTGNKNNESYLMDKNKPKKISSLKQTVDFNDRNSQNNYFTPLIINDSINPSGGLVFMSEAFDRSFDINGSFFGNLNAMINKNDMDISMAFYELMPDGKYFYLCRYIGRASYAKDNTARHLLTPGKIGSIPIHNTVMVSKRISKGSKLVFILNVNKHPYEVINYGTGKNVYDETIKDGKELLQIKWYTDSFIKIPIWK